MKLISILFLVFVVTLLAGCSGPKQPVVEQNTGNVEDVEDIGKDLTGLDSLDQDLDTSDLEGIEDDLNVDF